MGARDKYDVSYVDCCSSGLYGTKSNLTLSEMDCCGLKRGAVTHYTLIKPTSLHSDDPQASVWVTGRETDEQADE